MGKIPLFLIAGGMIAFALWRFWHLIESAWGVLSMVFSGQVADWNFKTIAVLVLSVLAFLFVAAVILGYVSLLVFGIVEEIKHIKKDHFHSGKPIRQGEAEADERA